MGRAARGGCDVGVSAPDEILEAVESALDGAERLLGVGCGIGNVVRVARGRCRAIHGCDVSEVAVKEAPDFSGGALRARCR